MEVDPAELKRIIKEEVEAALRELVGQRTSSLERYVEERFQFGDDWTVVAFKVDNPNDSQWVEISRLIRIFENIERHAGFVYDHLREEERMHYVVARVLVDNVANEIKRNRHSAMRKAVTMRDSAGQMARLLKGEDLDEPEYEEGEID